jgi:hypothetical protein
MVSVHAALSSHHAQSQRHHLDYSRVRSLPVLLRKAALSVKLTCALMIKYVLARQPGTGSRRRGLHQLAHGRDGRHTGSAGGHIAWTVSELDVPIGHDLLKDTKLLLALLPKLFELYQKHK